jgi:very-short-patch-repair endonuclease
LRIYGAPLRHGSGGGRSGRRRSPVSRFTRRPGGDRTRSDLERDFLRFCRRHDLPSPEVNVRVGRWTVDFLWPAERVAVETDSFAFHRGSIAFEDDHARDLDLRVRGYEVRRFTDLQLRENPAQVAADIQAALARAS